MEKEISKNKITMVDRVLRQIKDVGKITTWEAFMELGCTRLSEYIRQLRQKGYNICDKWVEVSNRYGEPVRYKEYFIIEN